MDCHALLPWGMAGHLPNPGVKPMSPASRALQGGFLFLFLPIYACFNWRIIALQNFVVFCQTSTRISDRYIPGSRPSRIQGFPQEDSVGDKESKEERKRLDLPWSTHKANKAPDMELALFTEAAGTPWWGEDAGRPLPGEDAGRLPASGLRSDQVLDAQAKKWTQRAPVPQGVILKEEERDNERKGKKERMTRCDQASVSKAHNSVFKRNFYTLTCT